MTYNRLMTLYNRACWAEDNETTEGVRVAAEIAKRILGAKLEGWKDIINVHTS